ncbi:hypothetical protein P171DRAFT_449895 [Karstenula rhodostoma CBS 690.94]|uniref:Uncharacterized protein n=1 Tax=Karstenula rhodostoma CBS 690.94 TaxID=1392251 RepID=A0A9P4P5F4_9PLEO|nr:hypothetical protein P171DRAFT_449895 [Karstenula rhodostoma CBS 690.94]
MHQVFRKYGEGIESLKYDASVAAAFLHAARESQFLSDDIGSLTPTQQRSLADFWQTSIWHGIHAHSKGEGALEPSSNDEFALKYSIPTFDRLHTDFENKWHLTQRILAAWGTGFVALLPAHKTNFPLTPNTRFLRALAKIVCAYPSPPTAQQFAESFALFLPAHLKQQRTGLSKLARHTDGTYEVLPADLEAYYDKHFVQGELARIVEPPPVRRKHAPSIEYARRESSHDERSAISGISRPRTLAEQFPSSPDINSAIAGTGSTLSSPARSPISLRFDGSTPPRDTFADGGGGSIAGDEGGPDLHDNHSTATYDEQFADAIEDPNFHEPVRQQIKRPSRDVMPEHSDDPIVLGDDRLEALEGFAEGAMADTRKMTVSESDRPLFEKYSSLLGPALAPIKTLEAIKRQHETDHKSCTNAESRLVEAKEELGPLGVKSDELESEIQKAQDCVTRASMIRETIEHHRRELQEVTQGAFDDSKSDAAGSGLEDAFQQSQYDAARQQEKLNADRKHNLQVAFFEIKQADRTLAQTKKQSERSKAQFSTQKT